MGTSSPWSVCTEGVSSEDSVWEDEVSVSVLEMMGDESCP